MDGLKGVIPMSCGAKKTETTTLFGDVEVKIEECEGCMKDNIKKHNGIYCLIKDWGNKDPETGRKGRKIIFIDLLQK
jgi:hypothetical protein